jgi:hypothetical protein
VRPPSGQMSALGLGGVKTRASAARVEYLGGIARRESRPLFSVALLRLCLRTPRDHDPFGSRTWQRNLSGLSDTLFDWRTEQAFPSPSEQAQTSLRLT